jgi:hypothetical protein
MGQQLRPDHGPGGRQDMMLLGAVQIGSVSARGIAPSLGVGERNRWQASPREKRLRHSRQGEPPGQEKCCLPPLQQDARKRL